jgi:hypothetical protein
MSGFLRAGTISYPSIILTSGAAALFICFARLTPCQLAKESNGGQGQERKLRDRGVSSERPRRPVKYWLSTSWKSRLEDVSQRLRGQRGNRRQTIRGALQF